jgi:hypothetical protein
MITKDSSVGFPRMRLSFVTTLCSPNQPYATHPLFLDNLPALRRRFRQIIQPGFDVDAFDEMFEMSAWLGQRYHYFDEIS